MDVEFSFAEDVKNGEHELAQVTVIPELESSELETSGLCGDYSNQNQIDYDKENGYELWP